MPHAAQLGDELDSVSRMILEISWVLPRAKQQSMIGKIVEKLYIAIFEILANCDLEPPKISELLIFLIESLWHAGYR